MYDSKDKVVLITGGAAGIGAGVVKAFLDEGAKHVAALDIDSKNGESLQTELSSKYGAEKFKFYNCDITTNDLEDAYDSILKEHGYIDAVVNCAGIMNDDKKVYLKEIAVNISALITSSLKAYDIMRMDHGGKGGTIINISSIVGLFKASLLPVYAATKSAVLQFSNCLGHDLTDILSAEDGWLDLTKVSNSENLILNQCFQSKPHYPGSGVRVLTICFGVTDTSLLNSTKMHAFDEETDVILVDSLSYFPMQTIDSAVFGLMEVFKSGDGGSTWLVTSNRAAEDITRNITEAYDKMSQGLFSKI